MSKLTKYGLEGASDFEDYQNWFSDTLGDLHDEARRIISEHLSWLRTLDGGSQLQRLVKS